MAISDPRAIKYSNEFLRKNADSMAQLYYNAKAAVNQWYSENMGSIITVGGGTIEDGADVDGRPVVSGNDANNVVTRMSEYITDMEANSSAKLNTVLKYSVNPIRGY